MHIYIYMKYFLILPNWNQESTHSYQENLSAQNSALKSDCFFIGSVNLVSYSASENNSIFIFHRNTWPTDHFDYFGFIKMAASSKKSDRTWDVTFSSFLQKKKRLYI